MKKNKVFCLAVIIVYLFAAIGCTWYLFYFHKPLFGAACILLAAMASAFAWPRFKELWGTTPKKDDKK